MVMYYKYTVLERRYQEFETIIVKKFALRLAYWRKIANFALGFRIFLN